MKKIGVFGGTFNPVHNAHVKTALLVKEKLSLDDIIVIPAGNPPHKLGISLIDGKKRLEMCKLAFKDYSDIKVSDIEIKKRGISYTYETLSSLSKNDRELYFICGADMFLTLKKWKNPEEIFRLAKIVTVPRNNDDRDTLEKYSEELKSLGASCIILDSDKMSESSSEVRERLKNDEECNDMLPNDVLEYINNNNLYRS